MGACKIKSPPLLIMDTYLQVSGITTACVDVTDLEVVKKEVERLLPIHLLVNNAAMGHLKKFLDVTPDEYDR